MDINQDELSQYLTVIARRAVLVFVYLFCGIAAVPIAFLLLPGYSMAFLYMWASDYPPPVENMVIIGILGELVGLFGYYYLLTELI